MKINEKAVTELLIEENLDYLAELKVQIEIVRRWIVLMKFQHIMQTVRKAYTQKVVIHRLNELKKQRARFVSERFKFWTLISYKNVDTKRLNMLRHGTLFTGLTLKLGAEMKAKKKLISFLAAT